MVDGWVDGCVLPTVVAQRGNNTRSLNYKGPPCSLPLMFFEDPDLSHVILL